jgi:hypothetical protein
MRSITTDQTRIPTANFSYMFCVIEDHLACSPACIDLAEPQIAQSRCSTNIRTLILVMATEIFGA